MKAITIHQPWADAIRCGVKMFETRSWPTKHRGEIAIHASKHEPNGLLEVAADHDARWAMHRSGANRDVSELPPRVSRYGAIIAVAELLECYPADAIPDVYCRQGANWYTRLTLQPLSESERALGDFSAGRFAWFLYPVRIVSPVVPCRGMQGIWTVPPEIEEQVRRNTR